MKSAETTPPGRLDIDNRVVVRVQVTACSLHLHVSAALCNCNAFAFVVDAVVSAAVFISSVEVQQSPHFLKLKASPLVHNIIFVSLYLAFVFVAFCITYAKQKHQAYSYVQQSAKAIDNCLLRLQICHIHAYICFMNIYKQKQMITATKNHK